MNPLEGLTDEEIAKCDFFDFDGKPTTLEAWSELVELKAKDFECPAYLGTDVVILPELEIHVSTVWLGLRMWPNDQTLPYMYETMVFVRYMDRREDDDDDAIHPMHNWMKRYTTKADAIAGHVETRENLKRGLWPQDWPEETTAS